MNVDNEPINFAIAKIRITSNTHKTYMSVYLEDEGEIRNAEEEWERD